MSGSWSAQVNQRDRDRKRDEREARYRARHRRAARRRQWITNPAGAAWRAWRSR